jgi:hypothetical protein
MTQLSTMDFLSFFLIGTHAEVGDGTGVVRGAFSYVDPRQQVRTVEYVADEQGKGKYKVLGIG